MFPDLRNNLKSSGSSLYECSINYSTLKGSYALQNHMEDIQAASVNHHSHHQQSSVAHNKQGQTNQTPYQALDFNLHPDNH